MSTANIVLDNDHTSISNEETREDAEQIDEDANSCEEKISFISDHTSDGLLDVRSFLEAIVIDISGKNICLPIDVKISI